MNKLYFRIVVYFFLLAVIAFIFYCNVSNSKDSSRLRHVKYPKGNFVKAGEFSYLVAITNEETCCTGKSSEFAGTIINDRYILTQARAPYGKSDLSVFVQENGKITGLSYKVEKVILHPSAKLYGDRFVNVALLKLSECINNTYEMRRIKPVIVEEVRLKNLIPWSLVNLLRFRTTLDYDSAVEKLPVRLSSRYDCLESHRPHELCIKGINSFSDSDLGGPMIFFDDIEQVWRQVGVSSEKVIDSDGNFYVFFIRTGDVVNWIHSIVDNDSDVDECGEISSEESDEEEEPF